MTDRAGHARKAATPWRGNNRMMIGSQKRRLDNARANQAAKAKLSVLEVETGRSEEWWEAWHREQRERVLRRYGVIE